MHTHVWILQLHYEIWIKSQFNRCFATAAATTGCILQVSSDIGYYVFAKNAMPLTKIRNHNTTILHCFVLLQVSWNASHWSIRPTSRRHRGRRRQSQHYQADQTTLLQLHTTNQQLDDSNINFSNGSTQNDEVEINRTCVAAISCVVEPQQFQCRLHYVVTTTFADKSTTLGVQPFGYRVFLFTKRNSTSATQR